jgi:hypothetical protein
MHHAAELDGPTLDALMLHADTARRDGTGTKSRHFRPSKARLGPCSRPLKSPSSIVAIQNTFKKSKVILTKRPAMYPFADTNEKKTFKSRLVKDCWAHHNKSLAVRDTAEFIKDFADDCIFINNPLGGHASGTFRGPAGVAKWCEQFFGLFDQITDFKVPLGAHVSGGDSSEGIVMISWGIENSRYKVTGGVDTFVLAEGQFKIVTIVYDVQVKSAND